MRSETQPESEMNAVALTGFSQAVRAHARGGEVMTDHYDGDLPLVTENPDPVSE